MRRRVRSWVEAVVGLRSAAVGVLVAIGLELTGTHGVVAVLIGFAVTVVTHLLGERAAAGPRRRCERAVIEGLPTETDLVGTLTQLENGEVKFLDALAITQW